MTGKIGVVADDTTGANDIGVMFVNSGYSSKVINYQEDMKINIDTNVTIVDTDSRLDDAQLSYDKVFKATKQLKRAGCSTFHNKTCSVFRGNIGAEFDAMLDALEEEFAVITLAFPKIGRQTKNGIHTVYGELLENSPFSNDPVHPMKKSNLISILSEQTNRTVTHVSLENVRKGEKALRDTILEAKQNYNYCIIDSETQLDLEIVTKAIKDFPVIAGSSAIGEKLPEFYDMEAIPFENKMANVDSKEQVLVVSGSLTPQTKSQTQYLKAQEINNIVLDTTKLFNQDSRKKEEQDIIERAVSIINSGKNILIMADDSPEAVRKTKKLGNEKGLNPLQTSKKVSEVLAKITKEVVFKTNIKGLVVAGGDTSGTVCRSLGIEGNYVIKEVETGVPIGFSIGTEMFIVLKSGSFGSQEFLKTAIESISELIRHKII